MQKNIRKLVIILICLFTLPLLAACETGGQQPEGNGVQDDGTQGEDVRAEDPITLTMWIHSNPAFVEAAENLIARYTAENPHVTIVLENFQYDDFITLVYTSMAAGTAPDILEMFGSVLRFAHGGMLVPIPESVMTRQEVEATFYESALLNRYFDGRFYGLPAEVNIADPGLIVNVGLLREQGVEIPDSWRENYGPSSWAEVMQLAQQLTIWEGDVMMQAGLGVVGGEEIATFLGLIWQFGGDFRDPDNMRVNINTPEGIMAAEFIMDLITGPDAVHSSIFSPRFDGFMEGTVAMQIGGIWQTGIFDADLPDLEYEYFNLPPLVDGANPYFLSEGGWGYFVPTTSNHPEEAWRFISFMLSDENQFEWANTTSSIPSNRNVSSHEYFVTGGGRYVIGRAMQVLQYGRDPGAYMIDTGQFVWDIARRNLEAITTRQVSIEEGLIRMEEETNEMITRLAEAAGSLD